MKLKINQKVLEKALAHANWIIEKKQAIPILGYILFEAESGKGVTITSTNMDMTIIDKIDCDVSESGKYCLPASLLYDITRKIRAGTDIYLEYTGHDNSIKLTSNKASFSIHYMESDGFPPITEEHYDIAFAIKTNTLKKAVDVAKVAMLQDNSRFHLNGIHMHYENELGNTKLRFVATDLFRISCVSVDAPAEVHQMKPIIVSKRTIGELLKLIDGSNDETVKVSISDTRISFSLKSTENIQTTFEARLINGTFPEYKAAIEVKNEKILTLNTLEFIEALDRVSTVVVDSTNSVKLHIKQNMLEISGVSRELGSAKEELEANYSETEPMEICFNSRYLLELLKEIETQTVCLKLSTSSSSTIIEPTETEKTPDVSMVFAVMPIEIVTN